jgi:hypothetical protein
MRFTVDGPACEPGASSGDARSRIRSPGGTAQYKDRAEATGKIVTATQVQVAPHLRSLFDYLDNQYIEEISHYHPDYLRIYPSDALAKLQSGDSGWERMVPPEVVEVIKERKFFGYRAPVAA